MTDPTRTHQELLEEISALRRRIRDLEQFEADRKKTAEMLRDAETRFHLLFDHSPDGIVIIDPETARILESNDTACRQLGYAREEFIGLSISDIDIVEEPEETKTVIAGVIQRGRHDFETLHRTKQGEIRNVHVTAQFTEILGQTVYHCIWRDITERMQAEEALTRSEEKFRKAFNTTLDAVNINRLEDGLYVSINPGFTRITGYTEEDIIGKTSVEINIWHKIEDRTKLLAGLRKDGEVTNLDAVFRMKNGEIGYGLMSASVINLNGVPHILNITRDITDRKKAEAGKKHLEEQLQHAQKLESIGTLAGGIAHDFNNLLMGIQGYASLALMHLDSLDPNYERLRMIEELVQSGADLSKQLLGFARGGRYEMKPTEISDIIQKTSSMFGRTKKEITIHRKFNQGLWSVEVDRGQMEQVFMNLYVNAWQAMPGGGDIYIETENALLSDEKALPFAVLPGRYVKITFTDTGTGMDEKTRERIFDPFFTTKGIGRGTGLGLAMVYGIVRGHKGIITVESELGHGTTFTLYLPASDKEFVEEKKPTVRIARGKETILVVDDEKMILDVSKELLESMGYRVYVAASGQEAVAAYAEKKNDIALVILDMIMPGLSGGETFDRLRGINPAVKVILASGYSVSGDAQQIMDRGCRGFLQKPFQIEKLSQIVREMLD